MTISEGSSPLDKNRTKNLVLLRGWLGSRYVRSVLIIFLHIPILIPACLEVVRILH